MEIIDRTGMNMEDVKKFMDNTRRILSGDLTDEELKEKNRRIANTKRIVKMIEKDGSGNPILNANNNE